MKCLIGILLLININVFSQYVPIDKQKHLTAGIIIGGTTSIIPITNIHPFWKAIITSSTAGVVKESYDLYSKKGVFDKKDIYFTALGGALSGATVYLIYKSKKRKLKFGKSK